ncbi:hypothetical protein GCM10028801_10730 [Nocardioides maradonensis]
MYVATRLVVPVVARAMAGTAARSGAAMTIAAVFFLIVEFLPWGEWRLSLHEPTDGSVHGFGRVRSPGRRDLLQAASW